MSQRGQASSRRTLQGLLGQRTTVYMSNVTIEHVVQKGATVGRIQKMEHKNVPDFQDMLRRT